MKIEFTKEAIEGLVEKFGREQAITEMTETCKVVLTDAVDHLDVDFSAKHDAEKSTKIYQVDVGNMPTEVATAYVKNLMEEIRKK